MSNPALETCSRPSSARVYRPRRPAKTLLHKITRENLETFLTDDEQGDDFSAHVPLHVEAAFRQYLKCGLLCHGFARAYCAGCGHDFLLAFSCKGRDICPSCSTRRMVETAAHMVDNVLPRVQFRQWVLSVPKRVRWHLAHKPEVVSGLLGVFLRAVETTIRQRSPEAPPGSRFGAVVFVHRFGSYLNPHIHYHVLVTDGVFSAGQDNEAEFHPALNLDDDDFLAVQMKMRKRGLRWLHRHGHLDDLAVHTMDSADHAGGWSVNASVTIPDWDRHGLERLVRYCARPPISQERLGRLNDETLVYSLRKPTVDGRTELVELLHNPAKAMTHATGIAGPIVKVDHPSSGSQAPVLWSAGSERKVAQSGHRNSRSIGSELATVDRGSGKDGHRPAGFSDGQAAERSSPNSSAMLGHAVTRLP
ncbi:MAG: transposase, partial [bacterium]|nr:transposase [bacterium]